MRLAWLSDIHLNFHEPDAIRAFVEQIRAANPDGVIISGDIGESPTLTQYLAYLENTLATPIYFVLGNHDYYHGSFSGVRIRVTAQVMRSARLRWLPTEGIVRLTANTALIGHGGWADGRCGDFVNSTMQLNDHVLITELVAAKTPLKLMAVLNRLGDDCVADLAPKLVTAMQSYANVVLVTHVPPFREAALYRGQPSNENALPHYTNGALGNMLREVCAQYPKSHVTVLCGHTHGGGHLNIPPNLTVRVATADYTLQIEDILYIV
jgi:Icc protein